MIFLRRLRHAWRFAVYHQWQPESAWSSADAAELTAFLNTPAGVKLKAAMVNLVLRQQARALSQAKDLQYEAGFATGQAAMVRHIEAWAGPETLSEAGEPDADQPTT